VEKSRRDDFSQRFQRQDFSSESIRHAPFLIWNNSREAQSSLPTNVATNDAYQPTVLLETHPACLLCFDLN